MDAASQKDKYTYVSVFEKLMISTSSNDWVNPPFNVFKTSDPNLGQPDVVFDDVTYLSVYPRFIFVQTRAHCGIMTQQIL